MIAVRREVARSVRSGETLRDVAALFGISHETARRYGLHAATEPAVRR